LESTETLHASLTAEAKASTKIGQRRWRRREIEAREEPPPPGDEKGERVGWVGKRREEK